MISLDPHLRETMAWGSLAAGFVIGFQTTKRIYPVVERFRHGKFYALWAGCCVYILGLSIFKVLHNDGWDGDFRMQWRFVPFIVPIVGLFAAFALAAGAGLMSSRKD
jgi:hypothetical protein